MFLPLYPLFSRGIGDPGVLSSAGDMFCFNDGGNLVMESFAEEGV